MLSSSYVTHNICSDWLEQAYLKYEVRTSLYGLNKANQYLTSEVLMDDDCIGGKDNYSQ